MSVNAVQHLKVDICNKEAMRAIAQNLWFSDLRGDFDENFVIRNNKICAELEDYCHCCSTYDYIQRKDLEGKEDIFVVYKKLYKLICNSNC